MKRNAGITAALAAILALFGIAYLPRRPSETPAASEAREKPAPPVAQSEEDGALNACRELRNRILRFAPNPVLPASCGKLAEKAKKEQKQAPPDVQFAVATVPNPITTHLQLLFDRNVEAIEQAAEDSGYAYDDSWLPWEDNPPQYSSLSDQMAARRLRQGQQTQPGVLVFRRQVSAGAPQEPYQSGLIIFVVGEEPTHGIDDVQFQNALDWVGGLSTMPENDLPILGPTFSGSLPSLAKKLCEYKDARQQGHQNVKPFKVASGSVSSGPSYDWFKRYLSCHGLGTFETYHESEQAMIDQFFHYLDSQGYDRTKVAILSEDQTAFGYEGTVKNGTSGKLGAEQPGSTPPLPGKSEVEPSCQKSQSGEKAPSTANAPARPPAGGPTGAKQASPLRVPTYLYYPRDISSLRAAYQRQSIFSAGKPSTDTDGAGTTLRGNLNEPAGEEQDKVRTYGSQLTPLAQEAALLAIAEILVEKRIEIVIIRSTNTLDQVFLAQFLKRACPSARVVLDRADLLFRRGAEGSALRGVMTLSTYPLFPKEQDWTYTRARPPSGSYRIFEEDPTEGLYIAARSLFQPAGEAAVPVHDYAPPPWMVKNEVQTSVPAIWVSVISHRQFWPLAALNPPPAMAGDNPSILQPGRDVPKQESERPLPRIPGETSFLMWLCLLWAGWHLACCASGSYFGSSRVLACFAPVPGRQHKQLILLGSLLVAIPAIILPLSCGLVSTALAPWRQAALGLWGVLLLAAALGACDANFTLPVLKGGEKESHFQYWRRVGVAAFAALFLLVGGYALFWIRYELTPQNRVPMFWRSLHLLSGVSPLLPQMLLLAGMYLWFWFSLQGTALFGSDRPFLPRQEDLPEFLPPVLSRSIQAQIEEAARPLGNSHLKFLIGAFLAALVIFGLALHGFAVRTLGERSFGIWIFVLLSACVAVILADTLQFLLAWKRLRELLVHLDRLRLRRTLSALGGLAWGSIWKMSGNVLEARYRIVTLQIESLVHLINLLSDRSPKDRAEQPSLEPLFTHLNATRKKVRDLADWYKSVHQAAPDRRRAWRESVPGSWLVKCSWKIFPQGATGTDLTDLYEFQEELAASAGAVLKNVLIPAWHSEKESLILEPRKTGEKEKESKEEGAETAGHPRPYVRAAEEFVILPYLGFIQNTLGRMRSIILGSLFLFVAGTLAVSSYPFDPLPVLGGIFLGLFLVTGAVVIYVNAGLHRDATLSHITNTEPGELGGQFWLRMIGFGIGPLIGVLTALFPALSDFLTSWLQPSAGAIQ